MRLSQGDKRKIENALQTRVLSGKQKRKKQEVETYWVETSKGNYFIIKGVGVFHMVPEGGMIGSTYCRTVAIA